MSETRLLWGFGFTGYRSFHGDLQALGPLRKVNLIASQNNSGKSNLLRFARDFIGARNWAQPTGLDVPRPIFSELEFAIAYETSFEVFARTYDLQPRTNTWAELEALFSAPSLRLTNDQELIWVRYVAGGEVSPNLAQQVVDETNQNYVAAAGHLSGHRSTPEVNVATILSHIGHLQDLPAVSLVDAYRRIQASEDPVQEAVAAATGQGLIRGLQQLQQPDAEHLQDKTDSSL